MRKVKYRRLYGIAAAVLGLMLLGTAGSADLGALEGAVLVRQASAELIGMIACARCAMGW